MFPQHHEINRNKRQKNKSISPSSSSIGEQFSPVRHFFIPFQAARAFTFFLLRVSWMLSIFLIAPVPLSVSLMSFLYILCAACLLDLLLGDPRWFPHPVRLIGRFAAGMESCTRRLPLAPRRSGGLTVLLVLLFTASTCLLLLALLSLLPPVFFWAGSTVLLYTTCAARDLVHHALHVLRALEREDLPAARQALALMVGRDTQTLDEAGLIRACVESVAENMSDGIVAPLFWAVCGASLALPAGPLGAVIGAVLGAMLYKAINTLDSMFGYKNSRYLDFGSYAARLDDLVNFFPARLSALALLVTAPLCGGKLTEAARILCRDHGQHSSPNAGWPEAAVAGALGLQLGGPSSYGGHIVTKPWIGDPYTAFQRQHIHQTCMLVLSASLLCLGWFIVFFLVLHSLLS
jgi:adenosylcobinamide-phosphate synthase